MIAGNPWFVAPFTYSGDVSSHIDIVSVALKYCWDNPAPAPTIYHK